MNRHQFQHAARQFRAGKASLEEFTDKVWAGLAGNSPADDAGSAPTPSPLPPLPERRADSHKGDYGRIAVVAGSRGMAGAAALAGIAALRSGAGAVIVATPRSCQNLVAAFHPAMMTIGLDEDCEGRTETASWPLLAERLGRFDCLVFGPGVGMSASLGRLAADLYRHAAVPVVMDADGLNNLGEQFPWPTAAAPRILTPHPGELRRLVGREAGRTRAELEDAATGLAARSGAVVVLKGHRSLVTDGDRRHHNRTGNAGMATAGSGDVLSGILSAFLGQGMAALDAAILGCHVHGEAGDRAARRLGEHSLVATDLIEALPETLLRHAGQPRDSNALR